MCKNLIYFSINETYLECLKYNLKLIEKIKDCFDVCCIIPENINSQIIGVKKFISNNMDLHCSRFLISKWEEYENYDNFLYLDADAILLKSPNKIFETINSNPHQIHGVKERENISNIKDAFFRFTNDVIDGAIGYNSGTFGFNRIKTDLFLEFVEYITLNKGKALNDQPLYNEFFNNKKIILPTLSKFVYLKHEIGSCYNETNEKEASIVHFLGAYGNSGGKLERIKRKLENNL